jgi:hypothetical protein
MGVKNTGFDLTSVKSTNGAIFLRIEQGKLDEVKVLGKLKKIDHSHIFLFSQRSRALSWCE